MPRLASRIRRARTDLALWQASLPISHSADQKAVLGVLDELEIQIAWLPIGLDTLAFELRGRIGRKAVLVGAARQLVADQELALGVLKDVEGVVDGMKGHLNVPAARGL